MKDEKTNLSIYKTTNYDQFKFYESNRNIKVNHLLEDQILNHNKLKYHPIHVSKDFYIIDGQHRLDICKKNNIPIYYIIDDDATELDIKTGQGGREWTQLDYLNHYSKLGYNEYRFILDIVSNRPVSISVILKVFFKKSKDAPKFVGKKDYYYFKRGYITPIYDKKRIINAMENFDEIFENIIRFGDVKRINKNMQYVLFKLLINESYNHERFISAINNYPDAVKESLIYYNVNNIEKVLLNKLYNRKRQIDRIESVI